MKFSLIAKFFKRVVFVQALLIKDSNAKIERRGKVVSAVEAVNLIQDGDTVATGGFVGIGFAEEIAVQLEERFKQSGKPEGITILYANG